MAIQDQYQGAQETKSLQAVLQKHEAQAGQARAPVTRPTDIAPTYPTQGAATNDITQLPNYERLTRTERWIMDKLPGFSQSTVGKALEWFNNTWAGKALQFLDVGAEGLERAGGFAAQWAYSLTEEDGGENFRNNLGAAWYAGSLMADMGNTPRFENGKLVYPTDLPGIDGVVRARQQIAQAAANGVDMGDALVNVRDSYLNDMGALALRAQLRDAIFHIGADPVNVVMPFLKPIERLNISKFKSLGMLGVPDEVAELVARNADEVADLARLLEKTDDAAEVTRITDDIARLQGVIADYESLRLLSPAQQKMLQFMGVLPAEGLMKTITSGKLNPLRLFQLTPEARASALSENVINNVMSRIVAGSNDPYEMIRALGRVADGTVGAEFGHMIATVEGRTVRSVVQGMLGDAKQLAGAWDATTMERNIMNMVADTMGETPTRLFSMLADGEETAVFSRFMESVDDVTLTRLQEMLLARGMNPESWNADTLRGISSVFDGFELYTVEQFKLNLMNSIADTTMRMAITQFGVEARGFAQKFSDMVKQAETLAFLKLNPSYPIKNFINNEFTMIARGNFGIFTLDAADDVFAKFRYTPARAGAGVGMAGDVSDIARGADSPLSVAQKVLQEATRGEAGWVDRVTDAIRDFGPKKDFGDLAQDIEVAASRKITAGGMERGWSQFYNPQKIADYNPQLAEALGDRATTLERAVGSVFTEQELDALIQSDNLNLSSRAIFDMASERSGMDINGILSEEFTADAMRRIQDVAPQGEQAIRDEINTIRGLVDNEIQNTHDGILDVLRAESEARISTDGPMGYTRLMGDVVDDFWGTRERHATDIQRLTDMIEEAKAGGNYDLVNAMWKNVQSRQDAFHTRMWDRLDARMSGFAAGAKRNGLTNADEITDAIRSWRSGWKDFYSTRNRRMDRFFDAVRDGKTPYKSLKEIQEEMNVMYREMIQNEGRYLSRVDNVTASMLPAEQRSLFLAWRNRVSQGRLEDAESVIKFREGIAGLGSAERNALYKEHWQSRIGRWKNLAQEERQGLAAMMGDGNARNLYQFEAERIQQVLDAATNSGSDVLPESLVARLENYIVATPVDESIRTSISNLSNDLRSNKITPDEYQSRIAALIDAEIAQYTTGAPARTASVQRDVFDVIHENFKTVLDNQDFKKMQKAYLSLGEEATTDKFREAARQIIEESLRRQYPDGNVPGGYTQDDMLKLFEEVFENPEMQTIDYPAVAADPEMVARLREMRGDVDILAAYRDDAGAAQNTMAFLPDSETMIPQEMYQGLGYDQLWFTRGDEALDSIQDAAIALSKEKPLKYTDLAQNEQQLLRGYINNVKGHMSDARYSTTRFAEWTRDSALLNYNRRMNYNTYLGMLAPYEFWATQSIMKWALHSIDRPAMLSTYLRIKKFLNTAYRPNPGMPSRLKGTIRIKLPFLPDWMGDEVFIDPLRTALPFDTFAYPFEQWQQQNASDTGAAERVVEELFNDGRISQEEYEFALSNRTGATWERAVSLARQDDTEGRRSGFDFLSMLTSPHAPIMWAYNAARGTPENIGPFMPITRTIKGATALLGISPNTGGLNIEGALRKQLGLPAFDQWDDYRVDRMLANMAADGEITVSEARTAMIDRTGEAFTEATRRAGIEFGVGAMGSTIGIPTRAYPEGEEHLRNLTDDYQQAWENYENGDPSAINTFYENYPEYEARLALFRSPEERMRSFLVDEVWDRWNSMTDLHKSQVREQLGDMFDRAFLQRDTRSYDAVPVEELGMWLKLMGGTPPGSLDTESAPPLELAPAMIANQAQMFYDSRRQMFPDYYEQQKEYFALSEGAPRRAYLQQTPSLKTYWEWRRDFMLRNPDVTPYLTDNPPTYDSIEELRSATQMQPQFTPEEWQMQMGQELWRLTQDPEDLPDVAVEQLETLAEALGITLQDIMQQVR